MHFVEKYRFHVGNPEKEIHIFAGKSTNAAIEKLGAEEGEIKHDVLLLLIQIYI